MSTADEIQARMRSAAPLLEATCRMIETSMGPSLEGWRVRRFGRQVCARRARLLRKRGERVQFDCRTSTGKARYRWMPALKVRIDPAAPGADLTVYWRQRNRGDSPDGADALAYAVQAFTARPAPSRP